MPYSTGRKPWRSEPPTELRDDSAAARQKVFYFGLLVLILFGILTVQLARLQLIKGETFSLRAETNRLRQVAVEPSRGLIFDRNGVPLVENRPSFAAAVVAADIPAEREAEITLALQELTGVPAGETEQLIAARRSSNDPFTPQVVKAKLPEAAAFALRERLASLPGVRVIVEPRREYVHGALLSHVLGFVGLIDPEEYARLAPLDYGISDFVGKTGVELAYESILRGVPGEREVEVDASGRELRTLKETAAEPGRSVVLSVDVALQREVTEVLAAAMGDSRNAAAVVIDVHTGEVLSLVSLPTFDNNVFTSGLEEAELERLLSDPAKPLLNHAISETFPPGSTFKQVTGLAALQEGVAQPGTVIFSPGVIYVENEFNPEIRYPFRDWAPLGSLDFYGGVAMSSDVYFYYLAGGYAENGRQLFEGLGATKLADWARRFGLGSATGVDLPGEAAGNVPDPTWKEATIGEVWTIGDTYNFGIGQGYLTTTPLQMVLVSAAIANGGQVLTPRVVSELRSADGSVTPLQPGPTSSLGIDARNLDTMREGMRRAVAGGTAKTAAVNGVEIAGKTGTAEFGAQREDGTSLEHGWFTGYAPFDDPEIAVVVFLEQGNGALTAAPVAARIFEYYFSLSGFAGGGTP